MFLIDFKRHFCNKHIPQFIKHTQMAILHKVKNYPYDIFLTRPDSNAFFAHRNREHRFNIKSITANNFFTSNTNLEINNKTKPSNSIFFVNDATHNHIQAESSNSVIINIPPEIIIIMQPFVAGIYNPEINNAVCKR